MSHPPVNLPPSVLQAILQYPFSLPPGGIPQPALITLDGPTYICDAINIYEVSEFFGHTTVQSAAWQGCWVPSSVDVYVDGTGANFVLDTECAQLYKYKSFADLQANNLSGVWGSGSPGAGNGQFMMPAKVLTDSAGNIYVADSFNHRIVLIDPSGTWHYCTGYQTSHFSTPSGIALDGDGNLYVADTGNRRIVRIRNAAAFITSSTPTASDWQPYANYGQSLQYPGAVAIDPTVRSTDTQAFELLVVDWSTYEGATPQGVPFEPTPIGSPRIVQLTGTAATPATTGAFQTNTVLGTPDFIWVGVSGFYVTDDATKSVAHFRSITDSHPTYQNAQGQLKDPAGLCVTRVTMRV